MDVRDKAILAIALTYGLRANELLSLAWSEIDLGANARFSVMGKGRKRREMPLNKRTVRCLRDWLAVRPPNAITCFTNRNGDSLSNDGLSYIVKKYAAIAATSLPSISRKNITPHTLRHSCAMAVLRATNDIRQVAIWLGHASVQSAEIYLHAGHEEKMEILEKHVALEIKPGSFKGRTPSIVAVLKAASRGK